MSPFFVWVKKGRVKKFFFTLVIDWNGFGEIIIRWKRGKKVKFTDMDYDCIMIMYVQYI